MACNNSRSVSCQCWVYYNFCFRVSHYYCGNKQVLFHSCATVKMTAELCYRLLCIVFGLSFAYIWRIAAISGCGFWNMVRIHHLHCADIGWEACNKFCSNSKDCQSLGNRKMTESTVGIGWLGGVTVRALYLQSSGRGFDSRSGRYQAT